MASPMFPAPAPWIEVTDDSKNVLNTDGDSTAAGRSPTGRRRDALNRESLTRSLILEKRHQDTPGEGNLRREWCRPDRGRQSGAAWR